MICLATNPEQADHTFDNCKILNNSYLLKTVYIKGCSEAKHTLKLHQKAAHQNSKSKAINNTESMVSRVIYKPTEDTENNYCTKTLHLKYSTPIAKHSWR